MFSNKMWLNAFAVSMTIAIALGLSTVSDKLGYPIFDLLQKIHAPAESTGVALIQLDQASLDRFEEESEYVFPLPRQVYGALANLAGKLEAKAIVFDIAFSEASKISLEYDEEFALMVRESKVPAIFPAGNKSGTAKEPYYIIKNSATALGSIVIPSKTGVYREYFYKVEGTHTLATAALKEARHSIPKSKENTFYLEYYQRWAIPSFPLYNVFKGFSLLNEGKPLPKELEVLRGKIWFVGYSAIGLRDVKPTPLNPKASGTLVHATAAANMIEGKGLHASGPLTLIGITVLMIVLLFLRN